MSRQTPTHFKSLVIVWALSSSISILILFTPLTTSLTTCPISLRLHSGYFFDPLQILKYCEHVRVLCPLCCCPAYINAQVEFINPVPFLYTTVQSFL